MGQTAIQDLIRRVEELERQCTHLEHSMALMLSIVGILLDRECEAVNMGGRVN